jgi:hypothetical protein
MMMMIMYCFSILLLSPTDVEGFIGRGTPTTIRRIPIIHCPFRTATIAVKDSRLNVDDKTRQKKNSDSVSEDMRQSFDPFGMSSNVETVKVLESKGIPSIAGASSSSLEHQQHVGDGNKQGNNEEMGIWAARGILLLVAAIWGTNFAVRCIFVCVCMCMPDERSVYVHLYRQCRYMH